MSALLSKSLQRAILFALLLAATPLSADVKVGIQAYEKKEFSQARTILQPLAEAGDGRAQFYVGLMYEQGVAFPRNYVQAYMWFSLSAAQSVQGAASARDELENLMTPDQRAEAQQLAIEWRPAAARDEKEKPTVAAPPPSPDRLPSRGPATETPRASGEALKSYLSGHIREKDRYSDPTIDFTDCVLTIESQYRLTRSTVSRLSSVKITRVKSTDRYNSSVDGLHVSLHTDNNGVDESRSSGSPTRSSVLLIPVASDFDFKAFDALVKNEIAACRQRSSR